ncbi:uncharacterized protein BT62DRAFT_649683 [Guyanagaster necrorhizus]|uniref:Uncharacterized protein n=1 Tax=Guyanagaster necrorhizus TaxID=856835 RepID=A0A9P8ALN6_9AGAR|nr:uncharacterized protein BT62DRAFT_649683 [Guyanagaster necrorhizus MCA 3950]KAG7439985.1 hypothetical protein BT62DRAFT_649683 [Guyanagaster necrorhizus MCA 3950]
MTSNTSTAITIPTKTTVPSFISLGGNGNSITRTNLSIMQPLILLKAICFAVKNKLGEILYSGHQSQQMATQHPSIEHRAEPVPTDEVEELARNILPLERLEAQLANEYGMTGDIDSVEVFAETKARAFAKRDAKTTAALKDLDTLYQLRLRASTLQLQSSLNDEQVHIHFE